MRFIELKCIGLARSYSEHFDSLLQQTSEVPWQWSVWNSESLSVEPLPLQQQPWSGGSCEVSGGRANRGGKGEVPAGGRHHGTVQTSQHHQDSWGCHHLRPSECVKVRVPVA